MLKYFKCIEHNEIILNNRKVVENTIEYVENKYICKCVDWYVRQSNQYLTIEECIEDDTL
jgi:hypothetical protein